MPFAPKKEPLSTLSGDALTQAMVSIGMRFASDLPAENAAIEGTLLASSEEGMDRGDLRVLSVLVTWFGVHSSWVNADLLCKLAAQASPRVRAFWASLAGWKKSDRRFAKLAQLHIGDRLDLLEVGTEFQLRRKGHDERFVDSPLRVPAGVLRDRERDVLTPAELAANHRGYYWRLVIGPTYRADAWAILEREPSISAAELARCVHCSFATAWHVRRDFALASAGPSWLAGCCEQK